MELGNVTRSELWSRTHDDGTVATAVVDVFERDGFETVVMTYELFAQLLAQVGLVKDD